jgi:release factor glutamine methyltransferase
MTLRTALLQAVELLTKAGIDAPRLTAEVLLCHALHHERAWLYAHSEDEPREVEWIHYGRYLDERMRGKPTQYITKKQEFYGRTFHVSPAVLIPRPETEHLVEAVLARRRLGLFIDVGCGSGAIAVTLALETTAPCLALDISCEAIQVARENARALRAPVEFVCGDLLSAIEDHSATVVVSNPPYVPEADRATIQREVRDWEPPLALFAGDCGLAIYRRLIPEAWRVLQPGGLLAMELGAGQAHAVSELLCGWKNLEIRNDLQGLQRVIACEKP